MFEIQGKYNKAKVMIDDIDETTMSQIYEFLRHPAFINSIAIMPDCHAGKGAVIGFTMPITDKVIPNTIGVDIGCGVLSFNVGKDIFDDMLKEELDKFIRLEVPFGYKVHGDKYPFNVNDNTFWKEVNEEVRLFTMKFNKKRKVLNLIKKCNSVGINNETIIQQIIENVFDGKSHKLNDNVMKKLDKII